MSASHIVRNPPPSPGSAWRARLAQWRAERGRFWLWVGLAALVHATLIIGVGSSLMTRDLGDAAGRPEGIAVELVDAADLESRSTVAVEPSGAPAPPLPPSPPAPPLEQAQPTPPPPEPQPEPAPATPEPPTSTASIEKDATAQPPPEAPADRPVEKAPAPKEQPKRAKEPLELKEPREPRETKEKARPERDALQLTMPNLPTFLPDGRATAVSRPPGITKSGENDEFARGVIRALRRTMPPADKPNRVSIRLLLTDRGNIQEVQLIRSGGDPLIDQNVVFAARQSNFPIPPNGATVADRTFFVTYVYH